MSELTLGKLHADYLRWHPAQVASRDIDPVYPVLSWLSDRWGLDAEQRAWLVFCHVVWYHPGSTLVGFESVPSVAELGSDSSDLALAGLLDLPCLTERRGHRPKQPLINHLLGLKRDLGDAGGARAWVEWACSDPADESIQGHHTPMQRWEWLSERLMTLTGNGRWASYKTAEMLQKVCGLPIEAPDAGHRYSSGPRKGLMILEPTCPTGQTADDIDTLDMMTAMWGDLLGEPDIAQVETSLCDFNSLVHGRYYLGHDIDSMQESFNAPKLGGRVPAVAWDARAAVFESRFLGEHAGRTGVQKEANSHYKRTGELLYV